MKRVINRILPVAALVACVALTSCYEDYTVDFDYSTCYFASQQPLRTLISREDSATLDFEMGVVLSGIRDNQIEREVLLAYDEELLYSIEGAENFELLPEDLYETSLVNNRFTIPVGSYLGTFDLKIDRDKFAALDGSLENTYAIPYRIVDAQVDSILRGDATTAAKDYTIYVVKYANEYSGTYYAYGVRTNGSTGEVSYYGDYTDSMEDFEIDTLDPMDIDLIYCPERVFTTTGLRTVTTSLSDHGDTTLGFLHLEYDDAYTLNLSVTSSSILEFEDLTSDLAIEEVVLAADPEDAKVLRLYYKYTYGGVEYTVKEMLVQRQDPEYDLHFEEWVAE
ncbi:MAG: DUF1735 domain-containing protein [Rikenellaceae bacterium]